MVDALPVQGRPTKRKNVCASGIVLDFILRVPSSDNVLIGLIGAALQDLMQVDGDNVLADDEFEIRATTSPMLLFYPYRDWRPTQRGTITFNRDGNQVQAVTNAAYKDYRLTYTPAAPIRGHVIIFFRLAATGDLESARLFDVSFVCASTGTGMDAATATAVGPLPAAEATPKLMVWNVNKLGFRSGKVQYIESFARSHEIGIWIEATDRVLAGLPSVQGTNGQENLITQGVRPWEQTQLANIELDFMVSLYSKTYTFGLSQCVKLPEGVLPSGFRNFDDQRFVRAPCAMLINAGAAPKLYVIPIHWPSMISTLGGEITLQTEWLLLYIEYIRVLSGLPIIVGGDFNTELENLMQFRTDASDRIREYAKFSARTMQSSGNPTKMHFVPKEYDFIWQPFSLQNDRSRPSRVERRDVPVTALTAANNCPAQSHQTMSREFSDHHPVIFRIRLVQDAPGSGERQVMQFDLVSFNLQRFNYAEGGTSNNPFNDPNNQGIRRRRVVLKNYLERFDVVALQEVSYTSALQSPGHGMLFGADIKDMRGRTPLLSLAGNLVTIKTDRATGTEQIYCERVPIYGSPDALDNQVEVSDDKIELEEGEEEDEDVEDETDTTTTTRKKARTSDKSADIQM
ncbi:hypothetical protein HDU88_000880, partial [Geranomyces variabilis]